MSDREVTVRLNLIATGFQAGAQQAIGSAKALKGELAALDKGGRDAGRDVPEAFNKIGTAATVMGAGMLAGVGVAAKAAMDWESAWAGVTKTVDGTTQQMAGLEGELRGLARTLPATHTEIAAVAEAAGQLGIKREDVTAFTRTMIDLGETTNLTADEAATSLAQFMNVMGTSASKVGNLGSAIVALGNDGASTEKQIVEMSQRIAAAGRTVGMTEADVLGFSSALSSVGVEAEAGGTAVSQTFTKMAAAVRKGGKDVELMAKTAGMSAQDFAKAWREDPAKAVQAFVEGLGKLNASGGDAYGVLEKLGMSGIRQSDSLMRLANAGGLLGESLTLAGESIKSTAALTEEAGKRYETTESKMRVAMNTIQDSVITLGSSLLPVVAGASQDVAGLATAFGSLPQPVQEAGVAIAGVAGSVLLVGGGMMKAAVSTAETVSAFRNLTSGAALLNPALLLVTGALAIAGGAYAAHAAEQAKAAARANEFTTAIQGQTSAINESSKAVAAKQLQESGAFDAARKFGISLDVVTEAALGNKTAIDQVNAAMNAQTQAASDARDAVGLAGRAWSDQQKTYEETAEAAKVLGGAVGQTNAAFDAGVAKARELEEATGGAAAKQAEAVAQFQRAASSAEITAEQAALLAASYKLIPDDVATQITAPGADVSKEEVVDLSLSLYKVPGLTKAEVLAPGARPSKEEVDEFVKSVGDVPGLTTAQIRTIADLYGVEVAKNALASVQGKTVYVTTVYQSRGNPRGPSWVAGLATGGPFIGPGPVYGPGTTTSDSINARLSNREFVHQASAHDYYGTRLMWALNHKLIPKEWFTPLGFAGGGSPSSQTPPIHYAPSMPTSSHVTVSGGTGQADVARTIAAAMPREIVVVDVNGQLIGRMQTEAQGVVTAMVGRGRR